MRTWILSCWVVLWSRVTVILAKLVVSSVQSICEMAAAEQARTVKYRTIEAANDLAIRALGYVVTVKLSNNIEALQAATSRRTSLSIKLFDVIFGAGVIQALHGDLLEEYSYRLRAVGRAKARVWLLKQVLISFLSLGRMAVGRLSRSVVNRSLH